MPLVECYSISYFTNCAIKCYFYYFTVGFTVKICDFLSLHHCYALCIKEAIQKTQKDKYSKIYRKPYARVWMYIYLYKSSLFFLYSSLVWASCLKPIEVEFAFVLIPTSKSFLKVGMNMIYLFVNEFDPNYKGIKPILQTPVSLSNHSTSFTTT